MDSIERNLRALCVKTVVSKMGGKKDRVYKALQGERDNPIVLDEYFSIKEKIESAIGDYMNTPLMTAVKELVPL